MTQGKVISLNMKDFVPEMGDRGSKSVRCGYKLCITVKEQRVDGSLVIFIHIKNYKVYSSRRETGS